MFSTKTSKFLKELAANNNRDWFAANKSRYESDVRDPALDYIEHMAQPLSKISPHFVASAKKSGGSLMRVYRDTRFSKDKTPYKTNVGIQFRHVRGKDVHAPGFYFHIEPGSVFLGAGIWKPESSTLTAVRTMLDEHPKEWKSLRNKLVKKHGFSFFDESLKRPPKGFDKEHPLIEDLKLKNYVITANLKVSDVYGKEAIKTTTALFKHVAPLVKFICEADDLEF